MANDGSQYDLPMRPRRLRRSPVMREALGDVRVRAEQLVYPVFVCGGEGVSRPVESMPGVCQYSVDVAIEKIRAWSAMGLGQFLLFGVVDAVDKDAAGSAALDAENPVARTLREIRNAEIDCVMHADLCFCEYTDHGHCGPLCDDAGLTVDNDATLAALGEQAVMLAEAGADVIAPSGMMDGMVGAVRAALDGAGHEHAAIMSYTVKYASGLYGPFRDAGDGAPQFGDRRGYQMDWRRSREWETELALDVAEGADVVMVKPAMAYLDVISKVRQSTSLPVAAYHVSGEYSMIHAAAERGWCDLESVAVEHTTAIARAGADLIITYFAPQLVDWLA